MSKHTIYWANISVLPSVDFTIQPLLNNIAKSQSNYTENQVSCPAIRNKHSNTFFSTIPYDINVMIVDGRFLSSDTKITPRQGLYANSYAFDWGVDSIFFSPTSQIMEVCPAFLHKTSYSQHGHAPSGEFDISKWFRPYTPTFQLWENETKFEAKKGEAHLYFNFPNEKRIELQEFSMSKRLLEIMKICVDYKKIKPKQPLSSSYLMFEQYGLQEETLKEIQANLFS